VKGFDNEVDERGEVEGDAWLYTAKPSTKVVFCSETTSQNVGSVEAEKISCETHFARASLFRCALIL
jgi:hypothetical protein